MSQGHIQTYHYILFSNDRDVALEVEQVDVLFGRLALLLLMLRHLAILAVSLLLIVRLLDEALLTLLDVLTSLNPLMGHRRRLMFYLLLRGLI